MTDLLFQRTAGGMVFADQATREAIQKIRVGQQFTATLHGPKKARSLKQHRLFRGLLDKVADATGTWINGDALLGVLKISLGYYDVVPGIDGTPTPLPRSTSFAAMPQADFARFFDDAIRLLSAEVLPDIAELPEAREIMAMLDGSPRMDEAA